MKAPHFLETSATLCAVVALTGCATPQPQIMLSVDPATVPPQAALPPLTDSSALAAMPPLPSGLDAPGPAIPSESNPSEPGPAPTENYSTLGGKADAGAQRIEFERREPKRSGPYIMLGDTDTASGPEFSWERTVFRQPGLRLFSIHF